MLRSIGKFILLFAVITIIAAVSGYITYNTAVKNLADDAELQRVSAEEKNGSAVRHENTPQQLRIDYYTVRLDGNRLTVYAHRNDKEEFLYSENIYVNDLSESDKTLLTAGVTLSNSSELTGFMENFTS